MRIAPLVPLLVVSMAVSWAASAQAVWKYVDSQGVTHYTDQPVAGAQKIELRSGNAATAAEATAQSSNGPASTRTRNQPLYQLFQIIRPTDQESVVNTGGLVQVSMELSPGLTTGHSIALFLDGQQVKDYPASALGYDLQNVERGTHTLVGAIIDENDRRVAETSKVTFFVKQKSIAVQPPVGPGVRPSTKPPATRAPTRASQPAFADLHPGRTPATGTPGPSL